MTFSGVTTLLIYFDTEIKLLLVFCFVLFFAILAGLRLPLI